MTDIYDDNYDKVPENFDPQQFLEDMMDAMSEWPEEDIRRVFSDRRLSNEVDFRWTIGGTEYTVISHFKNKNAETIGDKLERLMEREITA